MTGVLQHRPLVLVGDCWKPVVEAWQKHLVVSDNEVRLINFADDADGAAKIIIERSSDASVAST
jgi:hypothetical protein